MVARPGRMAREITDIDARKLSERPARLTDISSPHDTLNRSIISMLQQDGRRPFAEIAAELEVSEGTIRNRVNGMKQAGMLRIVAIADPVAVDYQTDAMMGVKVASGYTPGQVAERLARLPDVVYILWVSGRYDLLVEVVSNDRNGLLDFLDTEIHGAPDIASVEAMSGLKNYKNQFLLKSDWGERDGT